MKNILRIEELAMSAVAMYLISLLHVSFAWWAYILLFLSPDISMLGYAVNEKIGAVSYNIFHHKAVAITIAVCGMVSGNDYIIFAGLILFGHASFDRIMGYGLKYFKGFKFTHLGDL